LVVITKHAGLDASLSYNSVHSASLISKTLDPSKRKGTVDSSTSKHLLKPPPTEEAQPKLETGAKPPLTSLINSYDFEAVAEKALTKKAWAFYSSAATNLVTRDANRSMFDRIWFRPRLLRNIRHVNTSTTMLGHKVDLPFFVSPAAMARLAHPDGELALAKGAEKYGIAQCVCRLSLFTVNVAGNKSRTGYARSRLDTQKLCADGCRSRQMLPTQWQKSHRAYSQSQYPSSSSSTSTKIGQRRKPF
jgi:L-lactate dehydrogenase (cytochrome)